MDSLGNIALRKVVNVLLHLHELARDCTRLVSICEKSMSVKHSAGISPNASDRTQLLLIERVGLLSSSSESNGTIRNGEASHDNLTS